MAKLINQSCGELHNRLSAYHGDMQSFEGDLKHSCTLDKPQKQATAKAAKETFSINICLNCWSMYNSYLLMVESVLLLRAWKASFLESGHI